VTGAGRPGDIGEACRLRWRCPWYGSLRECPDDEQGLADPPPARAAHAVHDARRGKKGEARVGCGCDGRNPRTMVTRRGPGCTGPVSRSRPPTEGSRSTGWDPLCPVRSSQPVLTRCPYLGCNPRDCRRGDVVCRGMRWAVVSTSVGGGEASSPVMVGRGSGPLRSAGKVGSTSCPQNWNRSPAAIVLELFADVIVAASPGRVLCPPLRYPGDPDITFCCGYGR
jgi:hypothetical protein